MPTVRPWWQVAELNKDLNTQIMTKSQHDRDTQYREFSLTTDGQGRVVHFDTQGQEVLGYGNDDLASGLYFLDLFVTNDRRRATDNIQRILKGQQSGLCQYTLAAKSGRAFPVMMNYYRSETTDGLRCNIFLIPPDADFKDFIRKHHHMLQIVLEAIPTGMCIVDDSGIITHWNCAAERLTGIDRKQAVGQKCDLMFSCRNQEQYCPVLHKHKVPAAPLCMDIVINNNRPMHLQKNVNYIYTPEGAISGTIESFVDLTPKIEAETALNEARELSESARTAKRHFLANMNHEIRTPLNGIIGLLDLLLNDQPTASQRDNLASAKRSALLLLDLFDNILDFTVVDKETSNIGFAGFSLSSIISSVISRQFDLKQNWALAIHSHIDADVPDNLLGDPSKLYQILKQLVGNAIKFTPAGEVAIGVTQGPHNPYMPQDDAHPMMLHFSIKDTGVGIAENQLASIFEAMAQADDSSTRTFGGLGIGLTRVHRLVNLMKGRIWIESIPKKGTTVHFVLPFKVATAGEEPEADRAKNQPRTGKNILVGRLQQQLKLAPLPLTDEWRAQFKLLEAKLFNDTAEAGTIIKQLQKQAKQSNQRSVEKLLFRLLLAIRRDNNDDIHNYYHMLAHKLASGANADTIMTPEGERHENIDRRR